MAAVASRRVRRAPAPRRAALLVLGALALLGAACGAGRPAGPSATTTTASTTTTSTTLPNPVGLPGTSPSGTFAQLGPILRVPVVPLAAGALLPPPVPSGPPSPATVRIAYRRFGSGPDLVLIMGQHGTMTWWDPQLLVSLAGSFHVTVFDLPGVGYSAPAGAPETVESYADTTAGLIDALGLIKPVVLGWGLGGAVALSLGERHPGLATRLVLADASAGGPGAVRPAPGVTGALASPAVTTTALASTFFPPGAAQARIGWLARIDELSPDDIVASAVHTEAAVVARYDGDASVRRGLHALHLPVLVISGALDDVTPAQNATLLHGAIAHAQLLVLPDAGYAALFQDQSKVLAALAGFTAPPAG